MNLQKISAVAATVISSFAMAIPAYAVTLTGNPVTDNWTYVGNSLSNTNIIWARGSTLVNYDAYRTAFTLGATDNFNAGAAPFGGSAAGLIASGTWQVGDSIIGLGAVSTADLTSATYKVSFAGTGTWAPASSVGALDGVASFALGSGNGSIQSQMIQSSAVYLPRANQYRETGGTLVGTGDAGWTDYGSALKGWALVNNDQSFNEIQWLVNHSALIRLGMPVAAIGNTPLFSMNMANNVGADVSFAAAPIPEPQTYVLMLAGLAAIAGAARARRKA